VRATIISDRNSRYLCSSIKFLCHMAEYLGIYPIITP
jgi:hypothetical protein